MGNVSETEIVIPSETTPQSASTAMDVLKEGIDELDAGKTATLSCSDDDPSVLALQLCFAAYKAIKGKGCDVKMDGSLCASFGLPMPTETGAEA